MSKDTHNEERRVRSSLERGGQPAKKKTKRVTNSDAVERYERSVRPSKKGKKRKKKKILGRILAAMVLIPLMCLAAGLGIYYAKVFTTPYSEFVSEFEFDTLEYVQINKGKCNILIMGTDKEGHRTDVMMLAQIDPENGKATVMSIPRDTRVKYAGGYHKITEVHAVGMRRGEYGSEAAIKAVKDLTGIPIHHFVKVNFDAFQKSIDAIDGVDFDVPQRMRYRDPYQDLNIDLQPGFQHLDGDKSEQLVRFRHYKNGDLDRIKVQQDFLHALAEQKLQLKYINKIDDIYRIVTDDMETSMSPANFVDCGKQLLNIGKDNIETVTMPCTPKYIGGVSYVMTETEALQEMVETTFGYDEDGNEVEAADEI